MPGPPPGLPLAVVIVLLIGQRLFELALSARHAARLAGRGGVEHGRAHFPLFVAVHTLLPIALVAEVVVWGARPGPAWPAWLAVLIAAEALRVWAMRTLGERWTVHIWVIPGAPRIRRGPYRWIPHPNYVAVVAELVALPMMFGAWRTALAISLLDAVALTVRIREESRALRAAENTAGGGSS